MKSKIVYAMLTRQCNLSCPHCDVYKIKDDFNNDKFLEELLKFNGNIILFGGEPTLYQDRLFDIIDKCKNFNKNIVSISTNLMILNDRLIEFYKTLNGVATSWNPHRFTNDQYKVWYNNCKKLSGEGVKPTLLITMDNDLLDMGVDNFLKVVDEWDSSMFKKIKLEHYNGDTTPEYFERVDNFLCELYPKWRSEIYNEIFDSINNWNFDCSNVYTLDPSGMLFHGCPHNASPVIPDECYSCERVNKCRPCVLQRYCSFPKKFSELVNKGGNKNEVFSISCLS